MSYCLHIKPFVCSRIFNYITASHLIRSSNLRPVTQHRRWHPLMFCCQLLLDYFPSDNSVLSLDLINLKMTLIHSAHSGAPETKTAWHFSCPPESLLPAYTQLNTLRSTRTFRAFLHNVLQCAATSSLVNTFHPIYLYTVNYLLNLQQFYSKLQESVTIWVATAAQLEAK